MSLPHSSSQRKSNLRSDGTESSDSEQESDQRSANECALLTGVGRSAIAVIGLRGERASQIVNRCFDSASATELSGGQIRYGDWTGPEESETVGESVVVTPIERDHFEIHCHGGSAAIARILANLHSCGVTQVETDDWNRVQNRLIQEARDVLSRCLTERTAAVAMDQVRGAMLDWISNWAQIADQHSQGDREDDRAAPELEQLRRETESMLAHASATIRLADPFRVVLIGPPNVGKSSLLNAMVGYDRSITLDRAGTTRDVLQADTVIDGLPIRMSDTAGIRASDQPIEQEGIRRARRAAEQADLRLVVISPDCEAFDSAGNDAGPTALGAQGWSTQQTGLLIFNKIDLMPANAQAPADAFSTNALTGQGIPEILAAVGKSLGVQMPAPGSAAPVSQRQADGLAELVQTQSWPQVAQILAELMGVGHDSRSPPR